MKRIFIAFLILISFYSCSYGAVSEDMNMYVRKDLFEVYMQNIDSKLENILHEVTLQREDIKNLTQSLANLTERVGKLETRVDGVEKRFDDLRYDIYLIIGLLGVLVGFIGLPFVQKWLAERKEAKHNSLTLEDVEKVFERMFEKKLKGTI